MTVDFIWYWNKEGKKIYTRNSDVAQKAMKEGFFVNVLRNKQRIFRK